MVQGLQGKDFSWLRERGLVHAHSSRRLPQAFPLPILPTSLISLFIFFFLLGFTPRLYSQYNSELKVKEESNTKSPQESWLGKNKEIWYQLSLVLPSQESRHGTFHPVQINTGQSKTHRRVFSRIQFNNETFF